MRETRVASRYAKSLLDLAVEKNELEAVYIDMQHMVSTISQSKDLSLLLKNPIVKTDKKQIILDKIFSSASTITKAFVRIICSKNREIILLDIAESFVMQYKKSKGILTAELVTAVALDQNIKDRIIKLLNPNNQNVEVVEKINPDIIGGFIVRIDDKQVDASIQNKIAELKLAFSKNPYVAEI